MRLHCRRRRLRRLQPLRNCEPHSLRTDSPPTAPLTMYTVLPPLFLSCSGQGLVKSIVDLLSSSIASRGVLATATNPVLWLLAAAALGSALGGQIILASSVSAAGELPAPELKIIVSADNIFSLIVSLSSGLLLCVLHPLARPVLWWRMSLVGSARSRVARLITHTTTRDSTQNSFQDFRRFSNLGLFAFLVCVSVAI